MFISEKFLNHEFDKCFMSQSKKMILLFVLVFSCLFVSTAHGLPHAEHDLIGTVTNVTDGDTFDIIATNGTQFTIRLADVNASERGQVGYIEAKNYLDSLVYNKTVYLDIDDIYITDYKGTGHRLVCVSYVDYNSTHIINVNQALIEAGHAELIDYENEFNPYEWSLSFLKETIPEIPTITVIPLLITITLLSFVCLRKHQ